MNYNELIEKVLIGEALTENNRIKLKYFDQRNGKLISPHKLIQEEKEMFKPCIKGMFIKDNFVIVIEPKFENDPSVKIIETVKETRRGLFGLIRRTKSEITPELSYSDVRHYGRIYSPFLVTPEFELTPSVYKSISNFYLENWQTISQERFYIDTLDGEEESERLKELFIGYGRI